MKVEFKVTADLDTGEFTVVCPEIFTFIDGGWTGSVLSNYRREYKQDVYDLLATQVRNRFLRLAKLTQIELQIAELSKKEDK